MFTIQVLLALVIPSKEIESEHDLFDPLPRAKDHAQVLPRRGNMDV